MNSDPADSPLASTVDHPSEHILEAYCSHCRHEVDAVCPECASMVETTGSVVPASGFDSNAQFHRELLVWIAKKRNAKVAVYSFLIATGSGDALGLSMTYVAKSLGVTKALISKHCRDAIKSFNLRPSVECSSLPPSRYMRTEENAAKFRESNRRPVKMV